MLPKTSVIGAPSMRIRVGSLIETIASTATPSRASTICSAWLAEVQTSAISVAARCLRVPVRLRGRMGQLLEGLEMHAATGVAELHQVGLQVVRGLDAVDQRAQPAAHHHRLAFLAGHQLLRCERRAGVDALEPRRLELLPGLQTAVLLGLDVAEQDVLLPVDGRRCHVEHQPRDEAAHLFQVLAAGLVARDPEGLVDRRRHDHRAHSTQQIQHHRQRQHMAGRQQADGGTERAIAPPQFLEVAAEPFEVHGGRAPAVSRPCGGCARAGSRASRSAGWSASASRASGSRRPGACRP
mmetsp:Transcript_41618/g.97817  ORF Transcript_41618/g.97817 Transcript_41618/m.97817 type:complete len:296 (-) Transcript_41618:1059-1946(-)